MHRRCLKPFPLEVEPKMKRIFLLSLPFSKVKKLANIFGAKPKVLLNRKENTLSKMYNTAATLRNVFGMAAFKITVAKGDRSLVTTNSLRAGVRRNKR